jgi:hypothetical protein
MKKSILILAIVILVILNILLCLIGAKRNIVYHKQLEGIIENNNLEKSEISRAFLLSYMYQDSKITISEKMKEKLLSLGSKTPIVILRINFPYCESCVYPVLDSLESNFSNLDKRVIILTSFPNDDYAFEFNSYMANKPFVKYNIPSNDFVFYDSDEMGTFLVIMFPDLSFKKLFIPNKYNHFLLNQYLHLLFEKKT